MSNRLQNLQDWTNKHVFSASLDYWNHELHEVPSYQNSADSAGGPPHLEPIQENEPNAEVPKAEAPAEVPPEDDGHGAATEPITALQAAWNVTNAIQGMFIVGLPIAVKVTSR
ncbi:unnamed protein product [Caenorhabditis sp. 36 PRJEB53466]|nr:unnamed protein product [Caenorhabditis sp. 36 PRJEB53466]